MVKQFPFYARTALTLLGVVLVVYILRIGHSIFVPLVFGLLISILLLPITHFFERKLHLNRGLAAMTPVILFIGALATFVYFLAVQLSRFSRDLPKMRDRFGVMYDHVRGWVSYKLQIDATTQTNYLRSSANSIVQTAAQSAGNALLYTMGVLVLLIFIFMFTFFMLFHRKLLLNFAVHLFTVPHRSKVYDVLLETKAMINAYVVGLVIEMVIMGVANSTVLAIMGIQFALLLGVMSAVLNIIPYLGIYSSIVITVLVTFANNTPIHAFQAGLALFIMHVLDANILMPRIVGARVKMNPFITILAVVVGELVWGIPGMFLFIPITGMLKLICDRVEGLEAWGMLMGVDDAPKARKKVSFTSRAAPGTLPATDDPQ